MPINKRIDPLKKLKRWDKRSKGEVIEMPNAKAALLG
jgi:hypothetical protein